VNAVVRIQDFRPITGRKPPALHFTRAELSRLLGLYATRVIKGEWRDYAICLGPESASFMVFKRSQEYPLFVISKLEKSGGRNKAARHGRYVVTSHECKLRQGHSLDDVLLVFNKPLGLVTG
jgi:hypothetical protein